VYLLTRDQIDAYRRLGTIWPEYETRSHFEVLARQSLDWLTREVTLAKPRLILTLGADVAGILQGVSGQAAREQLLDGAPRRLRVGNQEHPVIHLSELGMVIRHGATDSPWPKIHTERHLPAVRAALSHYLGRH